MAKKKKQATTAPKYNPNTKLGRYIQDSGEYLDHLPTKGYYVNQQQQKALQRKTALKNYLAEKEKENRINAGRKVIESTITMPIAQKKFQRREMGADPLGKKWDLAKDGKTQLTMPALSYEESKALGRYTVGKKTGSNTPGVPYSESSKVYKSKEDIAAAYNAERDRRQAEYDAWKAEQRKNNKLTKSATATEKTGQNMEDFLAAIKQKKEEKTKQPDWQAQTAHAKNSADPWGKYAEVYEQKAKSGNASQKTTDDWKKATQASALLANNQNLAYGAKMAGVTPDEFMQQLQGTNKQLTQQEQKDNRAARLVEGKTDLGHWMGGTTEDVQETMRSGYASGFRGDLDRLIEEKYFDEGEDPYLMSDEGRANLREKYETGILSYQKQLEELEQQIAAQEKPANGWDPLLELYSTPEIENERKIIEGDGYTEEEKRAALEHLNWLLNRNTGYGSQSANDRARNFYRYNIHNLTDLRDHMNMDNMRRMAYDAMNGNGAYEKATAGMNPEERAALDDRIDNVLDYIADPNGELGVQKRTVQGQIEYTQSKIDEIDRLNAQDAKYAEMMAGVDELGDVEIDPATVGTHRNPILQNQYTPAHPVEYVAAILSGDYNEDVWINDLQYGQALLMSDDEKKKFANLYTNGQKDEAWAFYQGLEPMLNQMYHNFEDLSIRQTARRAPITATVATFGMHLAQPVEALINLQGQLDNLLMDTNNAVKDPYSSRYLVTRLKNGIRAQVAEDVGDWDWVYNGFTSGVDSALNVSIGKALGLDGKFLNIAGHKIPAMQAATLALFHTQAFETSLQNTMTQGNDQFGYDFIEAWIDAAVETATEIWSVENWMADPTNILRYVGKIAISEPSEEIVGAIIEPYIKEMLGHKNQYKERAKQILVDGGYTDGQGNWVKVEDMDTATRQAMREWNHDIRMAAQEALMSVGPSIVYGSARIAADTNRTGRAIQSNNINGEQNATRELAEAAARMNPETESYRQAQEMLERLKANEQISNYDAGKLATNIIRETNEQIGNTARQVLNDRVAEDLQKSGMQAEEAQEYAELITQAIEEGGIDNLSQKQRSKINSNNAALETYLSYRFNEETQRATSKAQMAATQGDRQSRFTAEALMFERKTNDNLDVGEQMATDEEKKNATGKAVKGTKGIIFDNQHARLGSMVLDADGKPKYQVYLEGQKEPVLADASEIRTTHLGTAAIIRNQAINPGFYSRGYVNLMLETMNDRRTENIPGILMRDAEVLRYAAYEQMEMPKTELPAEIAQRLYDYSRAEYVARRAADTQSANRSKLQPGQGYATFKGTRSGTAEFDKALKESKLSKADQQYVKTIADLAKAMGAELTLTDNEEIVNGQNKALEQFKQNPQKLYGAEKGSRITVNLGGMNFERNKETGKIEATGQRHNVVVTFGHEAVHFLQENTREGFDNLAQYVLNEQRNKLGTQKLNERLNRIMSEQDVDLYGAISELVADSCDNIFSSQEVIDHIQQTNKGLYQNLKNFAKNLITKLRNAIKSSMSADSKRLGNQVGSRLAKLFNLAWDEAASRELVYDEKEYQRAVKEVGQLNNNAEKWDDITEIDGTIIKFSSARNKPYSHIKDVIKKLQPELNKMDPVAIINENVDFEKYKNQGAQSAHAARTSWAEEKIKEFKTVYRDEIGTFDANPNRISNAYAYYKPYNVGASLAFAAIPDVVQKGIIGERVIEKTREGREIEHIIFGAPVEINNERGNMGVAIHRILGSNKLESYRILLPNGDEFELSNEKEMEEALLRSWPSNDGRKSSGAGSISNDIVQKNNENENVENGNYEKPNFSMAQPVEQTRDLIAVHNLTEQNLIDTLAEGGFTAPSIAVIRAATGHSKFGEISVIFNKDTIDPRRSSKNKVYGTDAWTPTRSNAQIETKLDYNKMLAAQRHVEDIMEGVQPELAHEASRWINEKAYHEDTTKTIDDWVLEGIGNEGLLAAYMTEKGMEIPIQYRQTKNNSELHEEHEEMYKEFLSELERHGMLDDFMREMGESSADYNLEKWGNLFAEVGDETHKKIVNNALEKGGMSKRVAERRLAQVWMYEQAGRKIETHDEFDKYATRQAMQNVIDRNDFEKWMKDLLGDAFGERGVYNGVDPYDSMGNKRSWERTHMAPTAENIVKAMYRNHDAKGGEAGRATGLMAKASKEYRNISEIREDQDRLQMMQDEEYSKLVENLDSELSDFWDELSENSELGKYSISGIMIDAAETYAKTGSISAFAAKMKQEGITLTPAQIEKAQQLMDEAREIPTGYFEAKPERVVGLDEIAKVILPDNTSDELLRTLDENGVSYEFYDGTDEDRLEKLNEQESAKFSRWTEEGLDVNTWMMNATPSTFQTEDEAALWQAYKDLRIKMSLSLHRQNEYQAKIKQLESKANLTAEERDELTANRNRLEIQQKKMADLEDELYQVTSSEGYAGMMYRQNMVLKDYIQGKTQDQVRQTVEGMLKEVQQAQEEIKKDRADLLKLAETQAVKTVESYMSKSSLGKMASMLRSSYNSAMSKGEIQSRLAEMALKQAQGEDITGDAEQLAQDLLDKMRGIQTDALQQLKGTTLKISEELAKEMRAENLTMADLRRQLKGSGVKIVTEKGANIRQQWAELYDKNQSLPNIDEDYSESGALHHILDFIQGEVDASRGVNQNEVNFDEVAAVVKIAAGNITTYLVDDPAARRQIENLMGQVKELAGKTGAIAEKMDALDKKMDEVVLAGQKAKGWTTILQRDVNEAIKYYNKTARVAAQVEKTKVRKALIEQLRSENTKKLIAQEEEFRERLKKDKTARALAQDNLIIRRKIHTVTKRMATLLAKETDQKNIPEKAKPLARQMLRMIANHDLNYRMVTFGGRDGLDSLVKTLDILDARDGKFTDDDLNWLIVGEGENADWDIHDAVVKALIDIETGLMEYRNAEGRANTSLMDRKNALTKVQQAVSKIYGVIRASQMAEINGRQMMVDELAMEMLSDMAGSKFKGEFQGWFGRKKAKVNSWAVYGNMTPEYFIRNLKNGTLSYIYDEYHRAENRAGLEYGKAQETLEQIAAETGYGTWDQKKKYSIKLEKGGTVELNIEQLMQLYATWKREETLQAEVGSLEKTFHLMKGGFYVEQEDQHKLYGRERTNQRAYRMTETDFAQVVNALTTEQKEYADRVVKYLSQDMSELGNEASMRMYGIKKYNEKYYFPFEIWNGVKAVKSDAGAGGNTESHRGAHPSFSNRLRNNASNALMIRGFTETAAKHIVQMINYNTFAPAIENLQRVMNTQVITGEEDNITNRNLWAAFGESYGKEALKYLQDFQLAVNGGVSRQDSSLYDKLLSTFRKSAVAGSLSVAAQQPLSYIRAAMEIDKKYLIAAWNPAALAKTKEIVREMRENSGVAMLKKMGKFDMGIGRSAQQFITPDAKQGAVRTAYNWTSDKLSALPELMDTVTWARIWTAVKMEQQAQNKGMDFQSKEFMEKVTNRFNEVLRLTQVYDSVLVRSANMRSTNKFNKMVTSFMAEPTLTANVLADALVNVKEKGGKTRLAKAAATFIMSAVAQAFVKGMMGAGRNPDKKKTWDENAAYRFMYNFISEINPLNLIPGYNDLITMLKTGEVSDDALGVVGKVMAAGRKGYDLISWKETDYYRGIEDSVGVIAQIFTNIPAKNIARDARAMYNFFTQPYAQRPNSEGVLTYQLLDQVFTADSLLGALNELTGEKIYGTKNKDYYDRIYNAERDGDTETAGKMREHLLLGKGVSEDSLTKGIRSAIKEDQGATDSEKITALREEGMNDSDIADWADDRYKKGELTREEATKLIKESNPKMTDNDVWWKLDRVDYNKETGQIAGSGQYYRFRDAIENGKQDDMTQAVKLMTEHGMELKNIMNWIGNKSTGFKTAYLNAKGSEKDQLRLRLIKAYKAVGLTESEAIKMINSWKETK